MAPSEQAEALEAIKQAARRVLSRVSMEEGFSPSAGLWSALNNLHHVINADVRGLPQPATDPDPPSAGE